MGGPIRVLHVESSQGVGDREVRPGSARGTAQELLVVHVSSAESEEDRC